jgi:phosphohistidine phosphatase
MLRHAEAVPHGTKPDADRELTPRGRQQAGAAGAALAALGEVFAACYSSPKVRARETAELACAHLGAC